MTEFTTPPVVLHDQTDVDALWPRPATLREFIRLDRLANPRDPKAQIVLTLLRLTQVAMGSRATPRRIGKLASAIYRALTEMVLGLELRPKTVVGPGLRLYHGFGLVVNDHCIIGRGVTLRNGVTLGHKHEGGPVPVVADGVVFGANAIALGGIFVGAGATIGAGAVVLADVPPGTVMVGNPARPLTREGRR